MAQSMVTIYKLLGRPSVSRYTAESLGPASVLRLLDSEEVGPRLIFKTRHFDPTSTAVIDELQNRFPRLAEGKLARRFKDEDFDVLAVSFPAYDLASDVTKFRYDESNVDELNLLHYLVRNAVSFWSEALLHRCIDSMLVIAVETLGPSLRDEDVTQAAQVSTEGGISVR